MGLYFSLSAFIITIMLSTMFFLKKRVDNRETKIYGIMLIGTTFMLFLEIFTAVLFNVGFPLTGFYKLASKLVMVSYIFMNTLFSKYLLAVCYEGKKKNYVVIIFFIISVLGVLILPLEFIYQNKTTIIPSGIGVAITYGYCVLFMIYQLFVCIKFRKKISFIKFSPYYIFLGLGFLNFIVTVFLPASFLVGYMFFLSVLIMYFTIENPDLQLLREFHKQREYANESNQEKANFLFNMSNQVKKPIETISKISSEALMENDIEEMKESIRQIKSSSNDLYQIVNNVLDISELEQRKIEIRGNKYHVYNLFNVINKTFQKDLSKNIEYRFKYDKSIPEYLYGDSIRIKQIMNILLENAKEYTSNGFIEVNINSIVKYNVCRLIITVEDSGKGMTADQIKHLFDKEKIYSDEQLKTIDDTKKNLGIVKSLINLMNGSIMVNSEINEGSKFTIVIDQVVKEEKTKVIETVEKYEEMYENNTKVLFVIPTEEISKKLKRYYKKYNVDITEVKGGQAGLERVRNNEKYDVIIMEENLPKLSSEDTLNKLKDTPAYKTPVILITDKKEIDTKDRYIEKGYTDVLFLPFRKEQVIKVIEEYIEK